MAASDDVILRVKDLRVAFPVYGGVLRHQVAEVKAVDGVSFELRAGETLGLVGESGSGKTTVGRAIINLLRALSPDVRVGGEVIFSSDKGPVDLLSLDRRAMKEHRAQVQMIFQDPYSSLNPRMTVREIVERPLKLHTDASPAERLDRVHEVLERVGLERGALGRYPHEFSGGQRQRIGIARAVATRPRVIIADEPVSALDVSVQAQVVNLMQELQDTYGLTYLFIAHDLSVVYHISDRIAVMYLGGLAEIGDAEPVYNRPLHPYSKALLAAVPKPDPAGRHEVRERLEGDIPTPLSKPSGCAFHSRCPVARPECSHETPRVLELDEGRLVSCPYVET
jgi:oligopeptide/dipeptide ABC transporter ATP-binding protein